MERVIQGLPVVTGQQWAGVEYFCTTRAGGVGVAPHDTFNLGRRAEDNPDTVAENRRRLRAALPAEPLWLRQVHGADVVDADDPATPQEPAADASVTARPGRVLAVMVADCLPVVIADDAGRVLGVAHAGWRGLSGGCWSAPWRPCGPRRRMPAAGEPGSGRVSVPTPSRWAGMCWTPSWPTIRPRNPISAPAGLPGKWLADLPGLAEFRLRRAGVGDVTLSRLCTVADGGRFFVPARRDNRADGAAGLAVLGQV